MDSRHVPAQHLAGADGRNADDGAGASWRSYPGGARRSSSRSAGPTTAPTRPASTTPSSSCRCGRTRSGRPSCEQTGWRRWLSGAKRPRTKEELVKQMNAELDGKLPGVDWNFSQNIRDNVMEALSGVKGDNSVKIFGPDLDELEQTGRPGQERICNEFRASRTSASSASRARSNLEFRVDPDKCKRWGVSVADVNNVVARRRGRQGPFADDRGREAVRHHPPLAAAAARQRDVHPRHPGGHHQQPGGARRSGPSVGADRDRHTAWPPPRNGGQPGRHDQPDQQHAPRLRLRDLVTPVGDGRPARPATASSSGRRLDDLPRAGQAA